MAAAAPRRLVACVVDFPHFSALMTERSQIVIGDGVPRLTVERVVAGDVFARVLSRGRFPPARAST